MIFVTSDGREIPLRRVSQRHVERIRQKFEFPDPPTYTFTGAGGVEVEKPHDETTLETAEDHRAWNEYQAKFDEVFTAQHKALVEFLIVQCIDLDPPPVEEWAFDFQLWDTEEPDDSDPVAFKVEWVESELVVDPDDFAGLIAKLYSMGGLIDDKVVEEFESFFRSVLERLTAGAG